MLDERYRTVLEARTRRPEAIAEAAAGRARPASLFNEHGRLMMIAADHPARGALRAGERALAMADRVDLLDRLCLALSRPGVNGVLGTPDVLEDLLLLGALEGKVVVGSMNRGGLAGTVFEIDDRFTAYDAASLARDGFEGGKMLLRIDPDDPSTVATVEACGRAVSELAARRLMAMVEPFIAHRVDGPGPDRPGRRGDHPGHDRGRRHRQHLRLHLAQGPGGGGDGAGHGRHHPARRCCWAARSPAPRTRPSRAGARPSSSPPSRAWSSAARCCTRPTTTSPRRSTPRSACSRRAGEQVVTCRGDHRRRRLVAGGHPRAGRLGLQRPAGPGARPRRRPPLRHRGRRAAGPAHGGRRRGRVRVAPVRAGRPRRRVRRRQRLRLRPPGRRGARLQPGRRPLHPALGAGDLPPGPGLRAGRGGPGGAARGRPGQPAGQQRLHPGVVPGRQDDRGRGPDPRAATGPPTRRTSTTSSAPTRSSWRRSTTSRSPATAASATSGSTARARTARSTCSPRCAAATWCWSPTATTGRRWPPPATTCTT